ncbi:hypothetical protein ACJJWD_10600 [Comamonas testosteroni]|uniref:hypothetical protein n=1 Tax=Comamonas testosteroni TaxID=285 RepID=UPI00389A4EE5
MGVEDLAMVFQGIFESLSIKKQESIKSARGIYSPKKSSCSEARTTGLNTSGLSPRSTMPAANTALAE